MTMHEDNDTQPLTGIYKFQSQIATLFKYLKSQWLPFVIAVVFFLIFTFGFNLTWVPSIIVSLSVFMLILSIGALRQNRNRIFSSRQFWQSRKILKQTKFRLNSLRFHTQTATRENASRVLTLVTLLRIAVSRIIFSVLVSGFFNYICWLLNQQINLSNPFSFFVANISDNSTSAYDGVLLTILTIMGIFITLYFTNMNTVMGTLYAELPEKARNLLLKERVGGTSVSFLIFLTIYVLVLLVTGTVFNFRPIIGLLVGAILGALIVPLFAQLSNRAFIFFDPTYFSDELLAELHDWVKHATIKGYLWSDESFQFHYLQQTENILSAFQALSDISYERTNLRKEGLIKRLLSKLSRYLPIYIAMKRQIPRNSRWYRQTLSHKDWYLTDYSTVALASQTRTRLQPTTKMDYEWFEREVLRIIEKILRQCATDRNVEGADEVLTTLPHAFHSIGRDWLLGFGKESLVNISNIIVPLVSSQSDEETLTTHEKLLRLQLISDLLALSTHMLLGYFETVEAINIKEIERSLQTVDWKRQEDLYGLNIPANTLSGIEDIAPRLQIELEAEGCVITPQWFITQAVVLSINLTLYEEMQNLKDIGQKLYVELASAMLENKQPVIAMLIASNGLEYFHKLTVHLGELFQLIDEMNAVRHVSRMRWVEWDKDTLLTGIDTNNKHLGRIAAKSIPSLSEQFSRVTDETPDFLGEALNTVGHQYFEALHKNDQEHAASLFRPFFNGSLVKYNALIPELLNSNDDQTRFLIFGIEPLNNLLELSGYAYLFAKNFGNATLWNDCRKVWDEYAANEDGKKRIIAILNLVSASRKEPALGSRWETRLMWRRYFVRKLQEQPFIPLDNPKSMSIIQRYVCNHPDITIRTLAPHQFDSLAAEIESDTAMSVFAQFYLYGIVDAKENEYHFEDVKSRIQWQQEAEEEAGFVPPPNQV
jgi:hypothetical protein